MKRNLITSGAWLVSLIALVVIGSQSGFFTVGTAQAVGDLTIDWGVITGDPIFNVTDLMPGQVEERDVLLTNDATTARPVGVRGAQQLVANGLSDVLVVTISDGGSDLYGGTTGEKTLSDFFVDSASSNGIPLLTLDVGESKTLTFTVRFSDEVENSFQEDSVVFDITLGVSVDIPDECGDIEFDGSPIFGTERSEVIRGTNGNDLIYGLEGSDIISGGNGRDCIIGGAGSDILRGDNGRDQIIGGEGSDSLKGGNGNDVLLGGPGSDGLKGGNGDDFLDGGDQSDSLSGGKGNDELVGGLGQDSANGNKGFDICEAEFERSCEI